MSERQSLTVADVVNGNPNAASVGLPHCHDWWEVAAGMTNITNERDPDLRLREATQLVDRYGPVYEILHERGLDCDLIELFQQMIAVAMLAQRDVSGRRTKGNK
jgi:hypothetical protein